MFPPPPSLSASPVVLLQEVVDDGQRGHAHQDPGLHHRDEDGGGQQLRGQSLGREKEGQGRGGERTAIRRRAVGCAGSSTTRTRPPSPPPFERLLPAATPLACMMQLPNSLMLMESRKSTSSVSCDWVWWQEGR